MSARLLLDLGTAAPPPSGPDGFVLGLLFEREQQRARAARAEARRIAKRYR